jgi:hypothetical protein
MHQQSNNHNFTGKTMTHALIPNQPLLELDPTHNHAPELVAIDAPFRAVEDGADLPTMTPFSWAPFEESAYG